METVRQVIDGKVLGKVLALPKPMQSMVVEVVIRPIKKTTKPELTRVQLLSKLKGSHTEALTGILKASSEMTLDDYRAERRAKYERAN